MELKYSQTMLCENIRRIAEEKKIKIVAISNALGMTRSCFCDLMHGRKILRAEYLPEIADALGVGIATLFEERK